MKKINEQQLTAFIESKIQDLRPEEAISLRLLGSKEGAMSGVFDNAEAAINLIKKASGKCQIYCGLNPVLKDKFKGRLNSLWLGSATKDNDVSRLRTLLIDLDPVRESGQASTIEELKNAEQVMLNIANFLKNKNITFKMCMSGNGYHILITLPSYEISKKNDIKEFLKLLKDLFETSAVIVDSSVFNPGRICKVYGTLSTKGENTDLRSHRIAECLNLSEKTLEHDVIKIFEEELLNFQLKNNQTLTPTNSETYTKIKTNVKGNYDNFKKDISSLDIVGLFKSKKLYHKAIGDRKHIVRCPNNAQHSEKTDGTSSTVIYESDFGEWPGFNCKHSHCENINLSELINTYFTTEEVESFCSKEFGKASSTANRKNRAEDYNLITIGALLNEPDPVHEWVVDQQMLMGGFSIVAAKPKVGKTTLLRSLAIAVAQGRDWLGFSTTKGKVIYLALEEIRFRLKREFKDLGVTENDDLLLHVASAPNEAIEKLKKLVEKEKPILVIVDTMFKLARVEDANSYSEVNNTLEPLLEIARENNCHIICAHHLSKADRDPEDGILGSTAIYGAFDTAFFITKESKQKRKIYSVQRYGENLGKHVLKIDPFTKWPQISKVAEDNEEDVKESILNLLQENLDGFTEAEIVGFVNKRKEVVQTQLRVLLKENKIARKGTGKRKNAFKYCVNVTPPLEDNSRSIDKIEASPKNDYIDGEF
jgi:hypothetical protein